MDILVINWHSAAGAAIYSGGARRARRIVQELVNQSTSIGGVDTAPSIFLGIPGMTSLDQVPGWVRDGVTSASVMEKTGAVLYAAARLASAAIGAIHRDRPRAIYLPSAELLPSLIAGIIASRRTGVPLVACATTIVTWDKRAGYGILNKAVRMLLNASDAVIVLGPAIAERLQRDGFRPRTFVGLTGVDQPAPGSQEPVTGRLLFLSRIVPEKGVLDAVKAFAMARKPDTYLEIRGYGPRKMEAKVKELAEHLAVGHSVRVGGPVETDEEKWRLMRESACYVAPSYMEHFGMAVRESLSVGVPTVVYSLPVFDDLRGHPSLFEVPLGNVRVLAEALGHALNLTNADRALLSASSTTHRVGSTWPEAAQRELAIIEASGR